jgi:hypothetical protein
MAANGTAARHALIGLGAGAKHRCGYCCFVRLHHHAVRRMFCRQWLITRRGLGWLDHELALDFPSLCGASRARGGNASRTRLCNAHGLTNWRRLPCGDIPCGRLSLFRKAVTAIDTIAHKATCRVAPLRGTPMP